MKIVLVHPDKLPKTYYQVIGEITYKWSLIEYLIHDISRYYLGLGKKEGRVAFYKSGAREKISVLKTTAHGWVNDENISEEIKAIAKETEKLNKERNNIVHGVWGHKHNEPRGKYYLLYVTEFKERIFPKAKMTDAESLQNIAVKINKLLARIRKLYADAGIPEP